MPKCIVDVPHVLQTASWDCGLACVAMVLQLAGHPCTIYVRGLGFPP